MSLCSFCSTLSIVYLPHFGACHFGLLMRTLLEVIHFNLLHRIINVRTCPFYGPFQHFSSEHKKSISHNRKNCFAIPNQRHLEQVSDSRNEIRRIYSRILIFSLSTWLCVCVRVRCVHNTHRISVLFVHRSLLSLSLASRHRTVTRLTRVEFTSC